MDMEALFIDSRDFTVETFGNFLNLPQYITSI